MEELSNIFVSESGILMFTVYRIQEDFLDYVIVEGIAEHHQMAEPFFYGNG